LETEKILGMLGLARRAGKAILGLDNIKKFKGQAIIIVLASDSSDRTKRKINEMEKHVIDIGRTKLELGHLLGVGEVSAVAVTDINFAAKIKELEKL